jgi:hypothetical protein
MTELVQTTFQHLAQDCLFFVPATSIQSYRRASISKGVQLLWRVSKTRLTDEVTNSFRFIRLQIVHESEDFGAAFDIPGAFHQHQPRAPQDWVVVEGQVTCPDEMRDLELRHRLPAHLKVGVAANIRSSQRLTPVKHRLFSAMPLPIPINLPVHVNGSFILAEDRRTIRFDDSGMQNPESKLNRWLLTDALAPVYYQLLALLPPKNVFSWWPTPVQDPISTPVVDGFFSHLASDCQMPICGDLQEQGVVPSAAIFLPSTPFLTMQVFRKILRLSGVVYLPSAIRPRTLATSLRQMNPALARSCLLQATQAIQTAFRTKMISVTEIQDVVNFLGHDCLLGLHLLPLADGSLAQFGETE